MTTQQAEDDYTDTLAAFDQTGRQYEPLTTSEVAAALDAERQTVYERLQELVDRGTLETKETEPDSRVWWRPPPDSTGGTDASHDEREPGSPQSASEGQTAAPAERADAASDEQRRWHRDYREIFEAIPDGVTLHEPTDGTIVDLNQQYCDMLGYTREELVASDFSTIHANAPPYTSDQARQYIQQAATEGPQTFEWLDETKAGEHLPVEVHLRRTTIGDEDRVVAVVRDISDRKEREREIRETAHQLQGILDAVEAAIFVKDVDGQYLRMNQRCRDLIGIGDDEDVDGMTDDDLFPEDVADQYRTDDDRVFEANETIAVEETVPTRDGTQTYLTRKSPIFDEDGDPYAVCAVATDITARRERERELERQRDRLTALNHLNDVVRRITDAIIDQSTREEIEQVVCDRLAAAESYRFAWICGTDANQQLEPRVEAGVDGYLDELPVSADSDDRAGPAERAVRTRELQITQHALDDPDGEPGRDDAREYGYRSSAAVPLVYKDTLYGVLGVYSERPDAFAAEEQSVFRQLGEVVGHAIASVHRKRALMSDEVTELRIQIPMLREARDVQPAPDGTITFERTVPLGGDEYLTYGTATGDAIEVLYALSEQLPGWKAVRTIDETDGEVHFEQHLSDSPVPSVIADHGGYFKTSSIQNGVYSATIHLPPGTDVRRVVDDIGETYPDVETVSQQQVTREEPSPHQLLSALDENLTERQRAALEAGYFGGFFDWPRERSGEEVAESLDVNASTFHQHIRKAEKKLLDVVFADS